MSLDTPLSGRPAAGSRHDGPPPKSERWPARPLPPDTVSIALLGVHYTHLKTSDGSDLYLTKYGVPFWEHLLPQNWFTADWFEIKRKRLIGTSTVYRVPTRIIRGAGLSLVVKWSRVGEDVPLDTLTIDKFIQAEFNSPFEEFSLLMELRAGEYGPPGIRIRTQRPLAIFVPSERLQLWQTGRSESKMAAKLARNPGVELDILRQYVVLYGWVKGLDLVEMADLFELQGDAREQLFARTTSLVNHELEHKGYRMVDMKPAHIIVRPQPPRTLLRDRNRQIVYAIIDYELLERTPEHEQAVRSINRQYYLQHMARRFDAPGSKPLPAHLQAVNLLGVDYICGHAESTGGSLWVVGKDPDLFNYFLPERWRRTPHIVLSKANQVFQTRTKDNINLVWKVSRLGETPPCLLDSAGRPVPEPPCFNSPFEEFGYALALTKAGFRTVYPRAIYMTGHTKKGLNSDARRYALLSHLRLPDGRPAVRPDHDYITIWGYWNGPDELLAVRDGQYYQGINAEQACRNGFICRELMAELVADAAKRLAGYGFEDPNLKPDHLLLSFAPDDTLVKDTLGKPEIRLCNFELLRALPRAAAAPSPAA